MLRLTEWMLDETYAEGGAKFEVELFGPEHGKLGSHATDGYAIHPKRGHAGVEAGLPTKDYHQFNFKYDHHNETWTAQANNVTLHNYLQDMEVEGSSFAFGAGERTINLTPPVSNAGSQNFNNF